MSLKKLSVSLGSVLAVVLALGGPAGAQQPSPGGLAGTTWTGTENLAGFNQLTFDFRGDGSVLMIDASTPVRGAVRGSWSQAGLAVTLRFGDCEYRGNLAGRCLGGTAQFFAGPRAGQSWTFQLQQN